MTLDVGGALNTTKLHYENMTLNYFNALRQLSQMHNILGPSFLGRHTHCAIRADVV